MSNVLRGTIVNPDTIYGKSAYEIAVKNGFDGTEEEWLDSLTEETANKAEEMIAAEKQAALNEIDKKGANTLASITESTSNFEAKRDAAFAGLEANENAAIAEIEAKGVATLATIPEDYTALNNQCEKNTVDIAASASRIDRNDKRITNIEKGITPEPYETDASVAYIKDVPEEALPYAELTKLGGMTRKCTQLIPYPYYEGMSETVSGITFVVNDSGGININGTATDVVNFVLVREGASFLPPNANISLSLKNGTDSVYLVTGGESSALPLSYSNNYSATAPSDGVLGYCLIQVKAGTVVSNLTVYPMINEGDAKPYEHYFEGLRSAPTTEVESVGVNLFDYKDFVEKIPITDGAVYLGEECFSFRGNLNPYNKGFFEENTQYTFSLEYTFVYPDESVSVRAPMTCFYTDGSYSAMYTDASIASRTSYNKVVFTSAENKTINYITPVPYSNSAILYVKNNMQINKGATAKPYTPYQRNTLPIPEAVQALDGYGEGVNESVYNYIDYEKKQFVKRVASVDLGTRPWTKESLANNRFRFTSYVLDIKSSVNAVAKANALCAVADTITNANSFNGSEYGFAVSHSDSTICLGGAEYDGMTAEQFTAAMSGVMLYYELATPEVTDISDILPADNYIGVEGGGTLTFKNQYEFDVPSEVTYQIKEATV